MRAKAEQPETAAVLLDWSAQGPFVEAEWIELVDGPRVAWAEAPIELTNIDGRWVDELPLVGGE